MPGTLSKLAKRKKKDYILYMYVDDEECGFGTKDRSDKWGRWKSTILQMTPELRESIMGHPELRKILRIFEKAEGNEPVSLRSTSKNLVALRTTEPQMFPIESVLFCPNGTLEIEWKSFPEEICWDMPEIKESKEVEEIKNLKRIMNEESVRIETLQHELNAALEKLQNLDIADAPRRKRQPGVVEKTAAEEIEEIREKFNQDIGSILGRLRHGPEIGVAENIVNQEEEKPVSEADQIPEAVPEQEEALNNVARDVQDVPFAKDRNQNDQNMPDVSNEEYIPDAVLVAALEPGGNADIIDNDALGGPIDVQMDQNNQEMAQIPIGIQDGGNGNAQNDAMMVEIHVNDENEGEEVIELMNWLLDHFP